MSEVKSVTSEGLQDLFMNNQKLVYHVINKKCNINLNIGFEYDDFVQVGNIGLWKACKSYNSTKSKFPTYACACIYNEIMMLYRSSKRNQLLNNSISIHTPIVDGEFELKDIIEDPNSEITYYGSFDEFLELLTGREKYILKLYNLDYTQKEISEILNLSQSYISRILIRLKNKYKQWAN